MVSLANAFGLALPEYFTDGMQMPDRDVIFDMLRNNRSQSLEDMMAGYGSGIDGLGNPARADLVNTFLPRAVPTVLDQLVATQGDEQRPLSPKEKPLKPFDTVCDYPIDPATAEKLAATIGGDCSEDQRPLYEKGKSPVSRPVCDYPTEPELAKKLALIRQDMSVFGSASGKIDDRFHQPMDERMQIFA